MTLRAPVNGWNSPEEWLDDLADLIVIGRPIRNDISVGEPHGYSLEDAHLCWQNEQPVEDAVLAVIGEQEVERAITFANERLLDEGLGGPDPDYLRDMRGEAA